MPNQPEPNRPSNLQVEEKAAEAHALLNNPVLKGALDDIHSRTLGILLEAEVGSLTAGAAHATLKAITDIRKQLEQYVADHKVRQKYYGGKQDG